MTRSLQRLWWRIAAVDAIAVVLVPLQLLGKGWFVVVVALLGGVSASWLSYRSARLGIDVLRAGAAVAAMLALSAAVVAGMTTVVATKLPPEFWEKPTLPDRGTGLFMLWIGVFVSLLVARCVPAVAGFVAGRFLARRLGEPRVEPGA